MRTFLAGARYAIAAVACALGLVCAGAPAAWAGTPYVDGISDQDMGLWAGSYVDSSGMFSEPFTDLFATSWVGSPPTHILYARFVTAPDAVAQGGACEQNLHDWYAYVTQLHLIPVIAVWDVAEGGCADHGAPSTTTYASDITQLLGYLDGLGAAPVQYFEAWNEPNASGVSASQAAAYWTAASTVCMTDACTAIAGDLVDGAPDQGSQSFDPGCAPGLTWNNLAKYEDDYVAALGAARPAIWGFHPYSAVNCEQSTPVTTFEDNLPSPPGQVWFTEVGAWECRLGQSTPRGPTQQNADASYLVNTLMSPTSPTAPAHVFWYELAALDYTQQCSKYADSALYEADTSPGPLHARPAAATVFGPDTSLAAVTGTPHDVTSTQATFDGTIAGGGPDEASYFFQYGTTSAYGSQTPAVALGPGLATQAVSATVSGLTPGIPYHYQLVATDTSGQTRDGADALMAPVVASATPTTVEAGGAVTVSWSGVSDPTATDWIGLYQPGAPDASDLGGFYADSCTQTGDGAATAAGSCTYTMPASGGTYELRLYGSPQSGLLTSSSPISVPTLSASASHTVFGNALTVTWTGVANATASDWIGLYQPGAASGAYLDSFYADSCSQTGNGSATVSGSCSYTLPDDTGTYELRLYASPATSLLATSGEIVNVPPVPVATSAPTLTGAPGPVNAYAGLTLSCSTGRWSNTPTGYAYEWLRNGLQIPGATAPGYVLGRADVGHTLSCAVTASNAGGAGAPSTSNRLLVHSAPPGTVLLGGMIDAGRHTAAFRFRATGASSGIRCALVHAATATGVASKLPHYAPCSSPLRVRDLRAGSYVLYVRAVGPGGPDPDPVTYRFALH